MSSAGLLLPLVWDATGTHPSHLVPATWTSRSARPPAGQEGRVLVPGAMVATVGTLLPVNFKNFDSSDVAQLVEEQQPDHSAPCPHCGKPVGDAKNITVMG